MSEMQYRILTSPDEKAIHLVKGKLAKDDIWQIYPGSIRDVTDECIKAVIELFALRYATEDEYNADNPINMVCQSKSTGAKYMLMFTEVTDKD